MTTFDDVLLEDDELTDEIPDESPSTDEAPQFDENTIQCPYCERAPFTGPLRNRGLSLHIRSKHPDEYEAWREKTGGLRDRPNSAKKDEPKETPKKVDRAPRGTNRVLTDVKENVEFFYTMAGSLWAMRDPQCGPMLQQCAKPVAEAWVNLARTNSKVRAFWAAGAGTTTWLQLAFAHMPLVFSIQQHHLFPRLEQRRAQRQGVFFEDNAERPDLDDLSGQSFQDEFAQQLDDPIGEAEQPSPTISDIGFPEPESPFH